MNKRDMQDRLTVIEKEAKAIRAELEKPDVDCGDGWVPNRNDEYIYISSDGEIGETDYDGYDVDDSRIALGGVYHPSRREELERVIELKKRYRARVLELGLGINGEERWRPRTQEDSIWFAFKEADGGHLPGWIFVSSQEAARALAKEFSAKDMQDIIGSLR